MLRYFLFREFCVRLGVKKIFSLLFIAVLGATLYGQPKADTVFRAGSRAIETITLSNGSKKTVQTFSYNGKVERTQEFVNNKREGEGREYSASGMLVKVANYKSDALNGVTKEYTLNGKIKQTSTYKNNELYGLETKYYDTELVQSKNNYVAGFKSGLCEYYYKSGLIASSIYLDTMHYLDMGKNPRITSVKNGASKTWYESGKYKTNEYYKRDKQHGLCEEYYEAGNLRYKRNFIEGRLVGKQLEYHDNGQLAQESVNGERYDAFLKRYVSFYDGRFLKFDVKGNPLVKGNYKNEKKQGKWTEFRNGNTVLDANYDKGFLVGEYKLFHSENGQLSKVENYKFTKVNNRDTSFVEGESLSYFKNEVLATRNFYANMHCVEMRNYFESGKLQYEIYKEKDIVYKKEYYESGQIQRISSAIYDPKKEVIAQKFELVKDFFEDGRVKYENLSTTGKSTMKREFNGTGKVINSVYVLGEALTIQTNYYPSGALKSEGIYLQNNYKSVGIDYLEWYENGKLKQFENYGIIQINWLSNGDLHTCFGFKNNNNNLPYDTLLPPQKLKDIYSFLNQNRNRAIDWDNRNAAINTSYGINAKKIVGTLKNGEIDGELIAYYLSGEKMLQLSVTNGVPNGKFNLYLQSGAIKESGTYCNGAACGKWFKANMDGDTLSYLEYDKPYFANEQKFYVFKKEYQPSAYGTDKNPYLKSNFTYKNGQQEGMQYEYYGNGQLHYAKMMVNGKELGTVTNYFLTGKISDKYTVDKAGNKQGEYYKVHYNTGNRMVESAYLDNKLNGNYKSYWPNGKLRFDGEYAKEVKVGEWSTYDSLGVFVKKEVFENGKNTNLLRLNTCNCDTAQRKITYAPGLKDLMDITRADIWQFPFHQSITKYMPNLFYVNYQTSSDRNDEHRFTSIDVVSFSEIITRLPNEKGLQLVLNPCVKFQANSRIGVTANVTKNKPKETRIELTPEMLSYRFENNVLIPVDTKIKASDASFKVKYMDYDVEGIKLHNERSMCFTPSVIASTKATLELTSFFPIVQKGGATLSFENRELLSKTTVLDGKDFYGIINGVGTITSSSDNLKLGIKNVIISNDFIAGEIYVTIDQSKDGGAKYLIGKKAYTSDQLLVYFKELLNSATRFLTKEISDDVLLVSFYSKK